MSIVNGSASKNGDKEREEKVRSDLSGPNEKVRKGTDMTACLNDDDMDN